MLETRLKRASPSLTSREWHEGRALLEGLVGVQKMLGVELLRRLELVGVIVHGVKKCDDICALCGRGDRVSGQWSETASALGIRKKVCVGAFVSECV